MKRYCQLLLQKLSNNGGVDAAEEQMKARQYKITKKGSIRHDEEWHIDPFGDVMVLGYNTSRWYLLRLSSRWQEDKDKLHYLPTHYRQPHLVL